MNQNFEENVSYFVEESFIKEKRNYRNTINDHIKEGLEFEYSFKKIEVAIYKKLDGVKFNPVYKDLVYLFKLLEKTELKEIEELSMDILSKKDFDTL